MQPRLWSGLTWVVSVCACGTPLEVQPSDGALMTFSGPIRVACGRSAPYTDSVGQSWLADMAFDGGHAYVDAPVPTISGSADPTLYRTERWGALQYAFSVPNGSYAVNLKFAEVYVSEPGQRSFDVTLNGATALGHFDIAAAAGGTSTPVDEQLTVNVTNGRIDLGFVPGAVQSPKINAIEILPSALTPGSAQTPYLKAPSQVPGRIAAVNYDLGGQKVAYSVPSTSNQGGLYRPNEAIGIKASNDEGAGFAVGWLATGSWLEYSVNVARSASYTLNARVASAVTGGAFHLEVDGKAATGSVSVPMTGPWSPESWTTVSHAKVALRAGEHVLRWVVDSQWFDFGWFELVPPFQRAGGAADGGIQDAGFGSIDAGAVSDGGGVADLGGLPATFFGMTQTLLGGTHDITIPVGTLRLWNTNCTWNFVEPSLDSYSFTACDAWFDYAVSINASPVFVLGRTPSWAIAGGAGACTGVFAPRGCAQLPSDLSGANTILPSFITAFASHIKARYPTLRWGIESIDEADLSSECAGAVAGHCSMVDLVTYQKDVFRSAHAVDATITVYGPSASTFNGYGPHLYGPQTASPTCPGTGCPGAGFLLAGGGAFMDAANFHPYFFCGPTGFCQTPEAGNIVPGLALIHSTLDTFALSNLPIVYSESDWGSTNTNNALTDDQKTEYYARQAVYLWDDGAAGHWWYSWDCYGGDMAACWGTWFVNGLPLPVVTAYATSRHWLLGARHAVRSCNHNVDGRNTWSCPFTSSAGVPSRILMNAHGSETVSVPGFTTQFNLDGTFSRIVGNQVTAGPKPIMVQ